MEDKSLYSLKQLSEQYTGEVCRITGPQAQDIFRKLNGRPPEALLAFLCRTESMEKTAFLGKFLNYDSVWIKFEKFYNEELKVAAEINEGLDEDRFNVLMNAGTAPLDIIQKQETELSPLYRYIMALSMGFYGEVEKLRPYAEQQLKENPWYFNQYSRHVHLFPLQREEVVNDPN
jgi:hypothetical protein